MDDIGEIFLRADIQQIREFLLHGVECNNINAHSYSERIELPLRKVRERLYSVYPNEEEHEKMMAFIFDYATAIEEVHMEIGLQIGAILSVQTYKNFMYSLTENADKL